MSEPNLSPKANSTGGPVKSILRYLRVGLILFFLLLVSLSSVYTLKPNHYAYVTRFSKMVAIKDTAGLHFKAPFIDNVQKIPAYQMLYDVTPSDVLTLDKKALVIDEICLWKIDDPLTFVKSLSGSISETEARIDAAVYSAVKNEFGRLNREEIISTDPTSVQQVSRRVSAQVDEAVKSYGISASVILKRTDLPIENQEAVFQRMIAERNLQSTSYLSNGNLEGARIRNDVDKKTQVILAEARAQAEQLNGKAEAEYMEILSSAYASPEQAEFYRFVRELDALKASFRESGTTVILDENSELVQALMGNR